MACFSTRITRQLIGLSVLTPVFALAGTAEAAVTPSSLPAFTIKAITLPGATSSFVYGISPKGNIAGCVAVPTHNCEAYVVTKSGIHSLGVPAGGLTSQAVAVNDSGVVAGGAQLTKTAPPYVVTQHGSKWVWKPLKGAKSAAINGLADGINDNGQLVGYSEAGMSEGRAEWKAPTYAFSAPALPKTSTSNFAGVDSAGDAVGSAGLTAYVWPKTGGFDTLKPPTAARDSFGEAISVSAASSKTLLAVGQSETSKGHIIPTAWTVPSTGSNHKPIGVALPELPGSGNGVAQAVSSSGRIVGSSSAHACLWIGGKVYDLNKEIPSKSGWILTAAVGIDTAGQIVGTGTYKNKNLAFELTPKA